jgi:hypothetical protein
VSDIRAFSSTDDRVLDSFWEDKPFSPGILVDLRHVHSDSGHVRGHSPFIRTLDVTPGGNSGRSV